MGALRGAEGLLANGLGFPDPPAGSIKTWGLNRIDVLV